MSRGKFASQLDRPVALLYGVRKQLLNQQWFTSTLLPAIPRRLRWTLRSLYFLPSDLIDRVRRERDALVPPKSQIFTGTVDEFRSSGEALVQRLVDLAGLTPQSRILDIGSGIGRVAVALTGYLDRLGAYEGIDIVPSGIRWCQDNITPKYPNFRFTLADIYNAEYNPSGRIQASEYRFPYFDNEFDVAVLASVFTHMLPADVEHYLAEISRVLRPGGYCYASYSLLNEESERAMDAGRSTLRFQRYREHCWTVDPKVPELAVGYDETYIRGLYERERLAGNLTVRYGSWSGRPHHGGVPAYSQDIVVGTKQ
jgi:SAM-dependent methyltransferase